jgi:hypothetical protein
MKTKQRRKDVLAHAGCAVKSVLGFIPTLIP